MLEMYVAFGHLCVADLSEIINGFFWRFLYFKTAVNC